MTKSIKLKQLHLATYELRGVAENNKKKQKAN